MRWYIYYLAVGWQFFKRDWALYRQNWYRFAINYIFFCPLVYTYAFGYLIPYSSGVGDVSAETASLFFSGSILWVLYPLSFMFCLELFFDLQENRYIDYQLTLAPARLILVERLFFFSCITWLHLLPYYPIARLLLGAYFDTTATSWYMLALILYLSALFFVSFNLFFVFFIDRMQQIGNFFTRIVLPLVQVGGLRSPLSVMYQFSYLAGMLSLCNPIMLITEGIRQALFQSPAYLSYAAAIGGLLIAIACAMTACFFYFKKRVDHI